MRMGIVSKVGIVSHLGCSLTYKTYMTALTYMTSTLYFFSMKKLPIILAMTLTACTQSLQEPSHTESLDSRLSNPLFAEQYYEALVQRMVELAIQEDPILEDESKALIIEKARRDGLKKSNAAEQKQLPGNFGEFVGAKEFTRGAALYVKDMLFFGSGFETDPGPKLHIFLTTIVDPRDVTFPDETAMDLGLLMSPYGAQRYAVTPVENPTLYRTVVLYDKALERVYGFAQLSPF